MRIGKKDFSWNREDVIAKMRGRTPEPIRDHVVIIEGVKFPPKQVIASFIPMNRQNFTTQGAQRVLTKLGFECVREVRNVYGQTAWFKENQHALEAAREPEEVHKNDIEYGTETPRPVERLAALEVALATAQEAIIGLGARVRILEES